MQAYIADLRAKWSERLLTPLTVMVALVMFVFAPLQASGFMLFQIFEVFFVLILVASAFILSGSRLAAFSMLCGLAMAVVAAVLRLKTTSSIDLYFVCLAWLIMGLTLGAVVARAVFAPGRVDYHRVVGAVLLYLTISIPFGAMYALVGSIVPGAFSGLVMEGPGVAANLFYFSFVTLTTTGYGDIVPVHPIARSICNLESVIGQLYPATLLARLVSLELADRR